MKLTEEQFDLIEAYLKDELSAPDRVSFEQDIAADAELRTEVNRQRDFRLGLRALGIQRALEQTRNQYKASAVIITPVSESTTVVRFLATWRYWAAAASVIMVLGVGYYAYQQTAGRQADIAYAETSLSDTDEEWIRSFPSGTVPTQIRTQLLDAFRTYKAGKYDEVIQQLKTLSADKKTVYYKNYLLGLSHLANKQPTDAIPLLRQAQGSPSPKLRQKAEWFLALAYVKNDQKERALPILKRISTDKAHPFQSLAQRVLRKIS